VTVDISQSTLLRKDWAIGLSQGKEANETIWQNDPVLYEQTNSIGASIV